MNREEIGTVKGTRGNWLPGNWLDEWTDGEDTGEWRHKETQVTVDRWLPLPKCMFCPQIPVLKPNHQGNSVSG